MTVPEGVRTKIVVIAKGFELLPFNLAKECKGKKPLKSEEFFLAKFRIELGCTSGVKHCTVRLWRKSGESQEKDHHIYCDTLCSAHLGNFLHASSAVIQ